MTYPSNHTRFEKIRISGWTMYVSNDFPKASIHSLCRPADQVDGVRGPFNKVDASEYARVYKCSVGFGGRCQNVYLKQFFCRSAWDFVKHLFRPSRARRAFRASLMLAEQGFCVPEIVALGERKYGPVCTSNFLITRELAGAGDLYVCFKNSWQKQTPDALNDKRQFIRALGETVGRMHREGIFHGDLRAGNVFAKSSDSTWQFFFLDNERTRKLTLLPQRLRIKNLVQVNMLQSETISNTDRMRFFASYLEQNGDVRSRWKDLARKVVVKTRRRLGHSLGTD
jgi:serine/threonine protein kinase